MLFRTILITTIVFYCLNANAQFNSLNHPVHLKPGSNKIFLDDFYLGEKISNASLHSTAQNLVVNDQIIEIENNDLENRIDFIKIETDNKEEYIPIFKSGKITHSFSFKSESEKVQIAGSFNGWNPKVNILENDNGNWKVDMQLDPGTYYYQVVEDGEWKTDKYNPEKSPNGFGAFNSILNVEEKALPLKLSTAQIIASAKTKNSADIAPTRINVKLKSEELSEIYVLWQNEIIKQEAINAGENFIQIILPEESKKLERSYIRVYAANENSRAVDLFIPIRYGNVISNTVALNKKDKHNQVLYFLMIDRFKNGDTTNDFPVEDKRVEARANYLGGDLLGVQQVIDEGYFKDLGISTLWLSPITDNVDGAYQEYPEPKRYYTGYHGYWPKNNKRVDEHFGNNQIFESVINSAHSNGHNLILDFVSNHVHEEHPMIQKNPHWKTTFILEDGRENIRLWDEQRLTTWFDTFLTSLDYENPDVTEAMVDTAIWWMKNYNLDGFRHDATKHIPEQFWRALTAKIKTEFPEKSTYQIGETFGSRELIGDYVGSGKLDGQFDFNLYFDLRDVLLNEDQSFEKVANSIQSSLKYYGSNSLMGNISGNHDMPRFMAYAGGDLKFEEDPKAAGWERDIKILNNDGYKKLSLLHSIITTLPGIPCIYYGDEIGLVGADDPDNRRMMYFENWNENEQATFNNLKELISLRKKNIEFLFGDTEILYVNENVMVIKRSYFRDEAIVAFNKTSKPIDFSFTIDDKEIYTFKPHFKTNSGNNESQFFFNLPAYGFELMFNN